MIIVGLVYKPFRSHFVQDQYTTAIFDITFLFILLAIARWGVGNVVERLRKEDEDSKSRQ